MATEPPKTESSTDKANRGSENTNPRILRSLQIGSALLVPAGIAALICRAMSVEDRVIAEVSITIFLVSATLLFASFLKRRLHVAIPAALSVILAGVLIILLTAPARVAPSPAPDPWATWEQKVRTNVSKCAPDDKIFDICIATGISEAGDYPRSNSELATEQMSDDLHAGNILMHIEPVKDMLNDYLGVKKHFLGDGFAQPFGQGKYYGDAQAPEYLVSNQPETHPSVWTWELSPATTERNRKLIEIVSSQTNQIKEISGRTRSEFIAFQKSLSLGLHDEVPALIRFERFPRTQYSHKMGLVKAKRVFALHLGAVKDLTVAEAAELSGHSLTQEKTDEDRLWIWVYQPADPRYSLRPTWGELIRNLKDLVVN